MNNKDKNNNENTSQYFGIYIVYHIFLVEDIFYYKKTIRDVCYDSHNS